MKSYLFGAVVTALLVCPMIQATAAPGDSTLSEGYKAIYVEDFELDVYEWTLMEKGATEAETPVLGPSAEAYEGRNVLFLTGKQGVLGLQMTRIQTGLLEMRIKFSRPLDYTRMFGISLGGKNQVLIGVNGSGTFAYAADGSWAKTKIPITRQWQLLTFDCSAGYLRCYIDNELLLKEDRIAEFDTAHLGINNGKGGDVLVDRFVVFEAVGDLSDENIKAVTFPLATWEHGFATFHDISGPQQLSQPQSFVVSEEAKTGSYCGEFRYGPGARPDMMHWMMTRAIELPGRPLKMSYWLFGDGSGARVGLSMRSPNNALKYWAPKVDWEGWRRIEVDLTRRADDLYRKRDAVNHASMPGSFWMGLTRNDGPDQSMIRIDDVYLTTRLNKDAPYVAFLEGMAEDSIHRPGDPLAFRLKLGNYADADRHFTLRYRIKDFRGEVAGRGEIALTVSAGEMQYRELTLDAEPRNGWYEIGFTLLEGKRAVSSFEEYVAYLPELPPGTNFDPGNPFGSYYGTTRQMFKVGESGGFMGRLDDIEKKHGLEAVAVWEPSPENMALLKRGWTGIVAYHAPRFAFLGDDEMIEGAAKWAAALTPIARRLRGLPVRYNILAEPNNAGISFDRCAVVLKHAIQGLKAGDPDAKIYSLNTSKFDWGRQEAVYNGTGILKEIYAAGAHPYAGPRHGSRRPERVIPHGHLANWLRLDDLVRRYNNGQGRRMNASEMGIPTTPGAAASSTWTQQAWHLPRHIIEYKTLNNFERLYYHVPFDGGREQWGIFTTVKTPKPVAASVHTLCRFIPGVTFLKHLVVDENIRAHLFERRDGSQLLTTWAIVDRGAWSLPTAVGRTVQTDIMGNRREVDAGDGTFDFDLDESVVYVQAAGDHLLVDAWHQAETRYLEIEQGRQRVAKLRLTNKRDAALKGRIVPRLPEGFAAEPPEIAVEVAPGGSVQVEFELTAMGETPPGVTYAPFDFVGDEGSVLMPMAGRTHIYLSVVR